MFDPQDLVTFVLDALAGLLPFLEVVKSRLLANVGVLTNLVANALSMVSQGELFLLVEFAFSFFISLLLGDDGQELNSGSGGLLGESRFLILELPQSGDLEVLDNFGAVSSFFSFASSLLTLVFFGGTLSSECVDISLSISSSLLKFTESLDLVLLLLSNASGFSSLGLLSLSSLALVLQDLFLKRSFASFLLLSEVEGLSVGSFNFDHHLGDGFLLFGLLSVLNSVLVGDVGKELELFLLSHLLLTHAETFTLLDLVDDNLSTAVLRLFAADLAVFLLLEILQAFNFHHEVKFLLLADPLFFELLRLDELLVTDGDDLRVEDHLVHFLDVVLFLVHEGLGLSQKSFNSLHVDSLLSGRR